MYISHKTLVFPEMRLLMMENGFYAGRGIFNIMVNGYLGPLARYSQVGDGFGDLFCHQIWRKITKCRQTWRAFGDIFGLPLCNTYMASNFKSPSYTQ